MRKTELHSRGRERRSEADLKKVGRRERGMEIHKISNMKRK